MSSLSPKSLIPVQQLSNMLALAASAHVDQYDKGGTPYFLHPLAVMQMLEDKDDYELCCIALGHDLVEDAGVTFKDLREQGFSVRVVEGIRCLTKITGESYEEYQAKVMSSIDAMKVKMCDLRHNSDLSRLKNGGSESDLRRAQKYVAFYGKIKERLQELKSNGTIS